MKKTIGYIILEAFLIGFSVLTAFWLENYREERENDKMRIEYYKRLRSDLKVDSRMYSKIKFAVNNQGKLIERLIKGLTPPVAEKDSLAILIFKIETEFIGSGQYIFSDRNYTLNSIITGARASVFERDTAFNQVQDYYAFRQEFLSMLSDYPTYAQQTLTPYVDKYFDRTSLNYDASKGYEHPPLVFSHPPNYNISDFQKKEFINILSCAKNTLMVESWVDNCKQNCENVLKVVESQIH